MSQVEHRTVDPQAALATLYEPIRDALADVEARLRQELQSDHSAVDELVRHGFRIGGKRLRPALVLLSGQAVGQLQEAHTVLAAVVEMIHTATLVHDDVLDDAMLRRHVDTVNARWNNETSVLLGDFLFTHAFYLASTLESTYACQMIGRATNIVCEGEMRQTTHSGDLTLTEHSYLSIIEAKTAELCACCCHLGAHYAGADPALANALSEYGRNIGIAFQIIDDLLDVAGDELQVGKSLGTDIAKRKMTLPLIYLRDHLPVPQRDRLLQLMHQPQQALSAEMEDWLRDYDALAYSERMAHDYARRSMEALEALPSSDAKNALLDLTNFVLARSG